MTTPHPRDTPTGADRTSDLIGSPDTDHAAPEQADDPTPRAHSGLTSRGRVKRTRASGLWVGLISAALLAIVFLIFIAQNSEKVTIHFLSLDGDLSLAIALLLSAVIGALVVAVPGMIRIGQLRHALRKNAKA